MIPSTIFNGLMSVARIALSSVVDFLERLEVGVHFFARGRAFKALNLFIYFLARCQSGGMPAMDDFRLNGK